MNIGMETECTCIHRHTVIRFFRCLNIFVHRKCKKIFYTNIILQQKFLGRWFIPCYTQAVPQLLLPIYPCIPGSL